jgi:hypothetical protein
MGPIPSSLKLGDSGHTPIFVAHDLYALELLRMYKKTFEISVTFISKTQYLKFIE